MTGKFICTFSLTFLLTACASTAPTPGTTVPVRVVTTADSTPAWRTCYFKISWPENSTPRWEVDLLLAHQIFGPVISAQADNIQSWRFHRRAARDHAGHLFRFHFYSGSPAAAATIDQIYQNNLRTELLASNMLESANCDSPTDMSRPGIGDTSDPNWPETVQNHWPDYIMGISKFWLGLIDDAITQTGKPATDINKLVQQYQQANDTITNIWQVEGEHALLHHLSGIFGYNPLQIRF
jgi:hypothetical protein